MQFEPNRTAELFGQVAGFLFSFLVATAIVTTVYSFAHGAFAYWKQAFAYFTVAVLAVVLVGQGIRRLLR
jgi:high-affinity Fe2+/Pb2+ permease